MRRHVKTASGSSSLPKSLFIVIAISGAVLIWFLKSIDASPAFTVSVPVSLIVLYCSLAWKSEFFYIREDQIGDNAYYLGFLFTLSSLAYALWRFQMDQGSDPTDIIGSFGVALWSTIIGIALRVFFSQMRQDSQDIDKEAREKIAQAANLLAQDLYQATHTFNSYTKALQQSVSEAYLSAQEVSQKTINSLENLNKKIESTEAPSGIINRKIDAIFSDLENVTGKLSKLANQQSNSINNVLGASEKLVSGIDSVNSQIHSMKDNTNVIQMSVKNVQQVSDVLEGLKRSVSNISESVDAFNVQQLQALQNITKHAEAMDKQLERSRKYTEETHSSLASMTKTLWEKLQ